MTPVPSALGRKANWMPWKTSNSEGRRIITGLVFLLLGILLVLWAWGFWVIRTTSNEVVATTAGTEPTELTPEQTTAVGVLPWVLMIALVLILVFIITSAALVRATRRYREAAARRHSTPTAYEDVWSMQRLPDDRLGTRRDRP